MYLRNEYETIAEYNAQAGTIAEKYHFLVIADFPVNFSDTAARRLINIATSGARCGVFTLIHWDQRHALPQGFVPDELRKNSICLVRAETTFRMENRQPGGTRLMLDAPPSPDFVDGFSASRRRKRQGFQPRRGAVRAGRAAAGQTLDGGNDRGIERAHRPFRRDQAAICSQSAKARASTR